MIEQNKRTEDLASRVHALEKENSALLKLVEQK